MNWVPDQAQQRQNNKDINIFLFYLIYMLISQNVYHNILIENVR